MSGHTIAAAVCTGLGVGFVWIAIVGMVRCGDVFDRLHFPGLAALYGPLGIAMALTVAGGIDPSATRAWLILAIVAPTSGILTHATARAALLRRQAEREAAGGGAGR